MLKSIFIVASFGLLSACNTPDSVVKVAKEDAVAAVNGSYISRESLQQLETQFKQRSAGRENMQKELLDNLIEQEVLAQAAISRKLDQDPKYLNSLQIIKSSLLSQLVLQDHLQSNQITDAELQAEYAKKTAKPHKEYKARHILLKTETDVQKLIDKLEKGADFAQLAKEHSVGPSATKGGDLGWFEPSQMVEPFSSAVVDLADNAFSKQAVKSQFGWHIILREGSREVPATPFAELKDSILTALKQEKIKEFVEDLRQNAKIEILLPTDADKNLDKAADATPAATTPVATPTSTSGD